MSEREGTPRDEASRRLADAMARSPELAAVMAARSRRRPRTFRRIAVSVSLLLVLAAGIGLLSRRVRRPPAHEPAELVTGELVTTPEPLGPATPLEPIQAVRDPATGDETAPFQGFAISVETDPPGALVTIRGVARGEAPALAGLECAPGERIEVRAELPGRTRAHRTVRCRGDTLVKLHLQLPPR
jgi:hypothetical protein